MKKGPVIQIWRNDMSNPVFGRAKAILIVSLMVLGAFAMVNVTADSPLSTGSRRIDAPAKDYTMMYAWDNGCLARFWIFGPMGNDTMAAYDLYYANGSQPAQIEPILEAVPEGIFESEGDNDAYSPFIEIYNVTVPDNYIDYTLLNEADVLSSGYSIVHSGNVAVAHVLSNGSKLVMDPDPNNKTWMTGMWDGSNVTMLVFESPDVPEAFPWWWNVSLGNGLVNSSQVLGIDNVNGQKHIINGTPAPPFYDGWSPLANVSKVQVPNGELADTYRDYEDLLGLIATDPTNYTISNGTMEYLVLFEDVGCGYPVFEYEPAVEYKQHETWVNDELIHYYDFGETTEDYTIAYNFFNELGEQLPPMDQFSLITNIPEGILTGHNGDAGYSHFIKVYNVTVPDSYEYQYINSPEILYSMDFAIEDSGQVHNCPIVPMGSTLENNLYSGAGPYPVWYNMQMVNLYCFFEDLEDDQDIFDLGADRIKTMQSAEFLTTGQRPVVAEHNSSLGYSPLWNVTYLEPTEDFVEDGLRNITAIEGILADPGAAGFNVTGTALVDRPLAGTVYDGPALFDPAAAMTYPAKYAWYDQDLVQYYDLGSHKNTTAPLYILVYENASDDNNTVVPGQKFIVVNMVDGIYTDVTGDSGYTGLWRFEKVMVPQDYEANTIKSKVDILASGYPVQQTDDVAACHLIPKDTVFEDYPGEPDTMQLWYKNNPVWTTCFSTHLDQGGYDPVADEVKVNTMYIFPYLENHTPIMTEVPSDEVNYTAFWQTVVITTPDGYEVDSLRDAATLEALLADTGSGYTSSTTGLWFRPIVGDVITDGIAPQADAGDDITTKQTIPVNFDASGSIDNVGIIEYTWTFEDGGTLVTLDGETATYTFDEIGEYNVTLNVSDAEDLFDLDMLTVTVLDGLVPVAVAGSDVTVELGHIVRLNASGSTDNVGIVDYLWDFGDTFTAPGMAVNHSYAAVGNYTVTLNVSDAEGNWATDTLLVKVVPANNIPTIDPIADQEVTEGTTFTYTVKASDADVADVLTFSLVEGPVGMTIDNVTGVMTFTPTSAMVGQTYTVTVMVDDGKDNVTRSFDLSVKAGIPATITVMVGPFKDGDGEGVKGAKVVLTYGGEDREGKTDANGYVQIVVPGTWIGNLVTGKVTKDDYKDKDFSGIVNADGSFSPTGGAYPKMKSTEGDLAPDYTFLIIAIIILIILALVLVSMRKPAEGEEEEDIEDEDEEEGEEDEEVSDEEE